MRGLLKDMKCGPWSRFEAGMGVRIVGRDERDYRSTALHRSSSTLTRNAHLSAASSISLAVGLPAPWPALVSMRIKIGLSHDWAACKRRGELEAVGRHDAVVVVGRRDQGRRVARARLDVVQRAVGAAAP